MDYVLPLLPFVAIVVVAAILWFATHKASMTRLESIFTAEVAKLKADFKSSPAGTVTSDVATVIQTSLTDLHAKMDAVREKLGGALTDAEKSTAAQDLDDRIQQAEDAIAALTSGLHDAQAVKAALGVTSTQTVTVGNASTAAPQAQLAAAAAA